MKIIKATFELDHFEGDEVKKPITLIFNPKETDSMEVQIDKIAYHLKNRLRGKRIRKAKLGIKVKP